VPRRKFDKEEQKMRIAYIGVGHWHTHAYFDAVAELGEHKIVGVADPKLEAAEQYAAKSGAKPFSDYRSMCDELRPELVFALGRHIDMADEAEFLIESGIPFAMEKPCGVNVSQIARIEALARAKNAFAAIPFAYRDSRFRELIAELSPGKEMTYGMFRQVPGPVSRYYDQGVEWNLDRKLAGGGCTLNLGIHFFDLVKVLAPSGTWSVAAATMSSELSGVDVEDFSAVLLENGGKRATVETAYSFPTPEGENVMSVNVGGDYYNWVGRARSITVTFADGREETHEAGRSQSAYYPKFAIDTIRRVAEGEPPKANLADMLAAAQMCESAYRRAGYLDSMA
jgi:predicted dehydrogenase